MNRFELFIALRYLRAKRKQAVISVITVISILGVAAGVMALVIALAITTGFRTTLQKNLLGVSPHISVLEKSEESIGIDNWRELGEQFRKIPHVTGVAPVLSAGVFVTGARLSQGIQLLGIDARSEPRVSETLRHLKQGSLDGLNRDTKIPGLIVGYRLAQKIGMTMNRTVKVTSPQGTVTPFGTVPKYLDFRVVGIFDSGFYDFDMNFAYASLPVVQRALSLEDVVNTIEIRLDNPDLAPQVAKAVEAAAGPKFGALTWIEQNSQLFGALQTEKIVTIVTIGLIELVAALNILIALVMMVMEKYRDIAVLISLGAKAIADSRHLHAAGRADRRGRNGARSDVWLRNLLLRQPLPLAEAFRRSLRAELRSVRAQSLAWRLDRGGGHSGEFSRHHLSGPQRHDDCSGRSAAL